MSYRLSKSRILSGRQSRSGPYLKVHHSQVVGQSSCGQQIRVGGSDRVLKTASTPNTDASWFVTIMTYIGR